MSDAQQLGARLKAAAGSVARAAPTDGAAVEDARNRLRGLETNLLATLETSRQATETALVARKS